MLDRLIIENVALIDKVELIFGEGLNILSGETGSGKSILIQSLNAILGNRIGKEIVKEGKDKAKIQALFRVDSQNNFIKMKDHGVEINDNTIVVSREITKDGKNTCRINGQLINLSTLKCLGSLLADVHSQFDNQSLLNKNNHLDLLDRFSGEQIKILLDEYRSTYSSIKEVGKELKSLKGTNGQRDRDIDMLKYQIEEIDKAEIIVGEYKQLIEQRKIKEHSEKINNSLSKAYNYLNETSDDNIAALELLNLASNQLSQIKEYSEEMKGLYDVLNNSIIEIDETVYKIRDMLGNNNSETYELEEINNRIFSLNSLFKKYGKEEEDVLKFKNIANERLENILNSENNINELEKNIKVLRKNLFKIADEISAVRHIAAKKFSKNVMEILTDLNIKNCEFDIYFEDFDRNSDKLPFENGIDIIKFMFTSDKSQSMKALNKIASGGELSRVMLALKTVLADCDTISLLVFDEIDSGIGGKTAIEVGKKLYSITNNHQVICVTHLAQIAVMADTHILVSKKNESNKVITEFIKLNKAIRINEIARLLDGNKSTISQKHAVELLKIATQYK